jgi:hypothetical protein
MASFHHRIKSGKKGAAAEHAAYITRQGKHRDKEDLVFDGYGNMPSWAQDEPLRYWRMADKYERVNGAAYREHEIALPCELTLDQQMDLVEDLITGLVEDRTYQYAIHTPVSSLGDEVNVHVHLMYSGRLQDGIERSPEQTFRRHNAIEPRRGGCKKDSGGKDRLAMREEAVAARMKCAELQNAALEKYGHQARVDHRSLKERGVGRKPERHLGQARIRNMSVKERSAYVAARHDH